MARKVKKPAAVNPYGTPDQQDRKRGVQPGTIYRRPYTRPIPNWSGPRGDRSARPAPLPARYSGRRWRNV